MRLERDYLELLVDNYLNQELDSIIAESQSSQTTIRDLSAKISEATAHMGKYNLSPSAFIVIRGVNSANLLAWILAAIKKRVPFCIESNDIKQADSVSAQLSEYGNVLVVELGSNSGNLSYITKKNQCKDFGNREWVYVVKTSGSTGVPKIIPISRSNLSSMLFAANEKFTFVSGETWLWEHRPSFDLALWEIFGCVLFKGKFIISPTPIAEWSVVEYRKIAEFSPQNITLTPSELKKIGQLDAATSQQFFEDARSILFCGERLGWDALRHLPSNVTPDEVQIYNAYGPSEATIFCSVHLLTSQDMALSSVPIGDPMGDMCLRVNISSGELFLSGSQVFEGYLGDGIVKTDEYATGDIVEKKETGDLIFKGRSSGFLKINGERIDPSRTVDILLSQKDVEDAYLWVVSCPPFDQVFAAIKTDGTSSIDKRTLRQVVSNSGVLPRPTRYIFLSPNEWPITDRGKIDHNKISELTNKENQK